MPNTKTEQLSLRMSPRAKALLRAAAAKEHRSASNMLEHLVLEYCERNGITLNDTPVPQEKQPQSKDSAR